jgi:hypothetical protein
LASTLTITSDTGITFEGGDGRLNIADNGLIVDYDAAAPSPSASVRAQITAGQIHSTLDLGGDRYALGYREATAADLSFMGSSVDGSATLVRMTLAGDANLDGAVQFSDLVALARHYNASGQDWESGDFSYDGDVNFTDLVILAQNYNQTLTPASIASVGAELASDYALARSLVPEPAVMIVSAAMLCLSVHRDRRRDA